MVVRLFSCRHPAILSMDSIFLKTFRLISCCILLFLFFTRAQAGDPGGGNHASLLLTQALAERILGAPVNANGGNTMPDIATGRTWASRAAYVVKSGDGERAAITLLMGHVSTKAEAKDIFESNKEASHGVAVPGLGDAAYRTTEPAQLNVLRGATWLILSVGTPSKPDTAGQEKAAKEILAKLAE